MLAEIKLNLICLIIAIKNDIKMTGEMAPVPASASLW
jgi:hypothetical protein